ncbi:unnamed protein product [Rhizophagus irregularis]|nr:unnamed protein product [Rhizophagus irregularis]CAB5383558.1 unnamed protein product [Rhizophagus irregularis]
MGSIINCIDDRDFASQPSSPVLEPEKSKEMLAPTQGDGSISKYFKYIKYYAMLTCKDLDDVDVKVKFLSGLSPDNEKRVEEFGFKKPLKEIVKYLVRDPTLSTEIQKYKAGELKQGSESVREFYQRLESSPEVIRIPSIERNYFADFHLQIKMKSNHGGSIFLWMR